MSNYLDMQNAIADDLDRADLGDQIKKAINRAIDFYSTENFYFKETTGTFNLIVGQNSYGTADGIPSNIREIYYAQITVSSFDYELIPRSIQWIQDRDPDNYDGDPTDYAWYQQKIWVSPTPDTVRVITLYYTKDYTALSADTDENDFTTIELAEELIRARSEWLLYKQVLHDPQNSRDAKEMELEALEQLRRQTENFKLGVMNTPFKS